MTSKASRACVRRVQINGREARTEMALAECRASDHARICRSTIRAADDPLDEPSDASIAYAEHTLEGFEVMRVAANP